MPDSRWEVACHEAGHAAVALAMGGKVRGLVLYGDGEGQADLDELLGHRLAFAIAGGPAGERFAKDHPRPTESPAGPRALTAGEIEALPVAASSPYLACQLGRTPEHRNKKYLSDDRSLALLAIEGIESTPHAWVSRREHFDRMAAEIVRRNVDAVLRIARRLFVAGSLSASEVEDLFNGAANV